MRLNGISKTALGAGSWIETATAFRANRFARFSGGGQLTDNKFYNRVGGERISSRQIDELIGLARGLAADGTINKAEIEFLQKWLAANGEISNQPIIRTLYRRVNDILSDGAVDADEHAELLDTLDSFSTRDFEL
ncbi:hypothetical protein [Mesorhizobium sp. B2-6-4]|uniref:hypothetical protein n=1 Tax=Mesorhizobium sp. B2-6-4 TaxID=2589913 RepID=UPI001FEE68C5|nr:hypothetical protein [Mesorhizobium sp. B2-6-4]